MKNTFPRVSLSIEYGQNSQTGSLSLLSIGYALQQAWIYATMFSASELTGIKHTLTGVFGTNFSISLAISMLTFSVSLLFMGLKDQNLKETIRTKKAVTTNALLMSLGTILLIIQGVYSVQHPILEILSGLATGIGSSVLLIAWGVRFARCSIVTICINAVLAIFLGFIIYAYILMALPCPFGGLCTALIPLIELLILAKHPYLAVDSPREQLRFLPLKVSNAKFIAKIGFPIFIFGLCLGILRHTVIQSIPLMNAQLVMTTASLAVVTLFILTVLLQKHEAVWNFDFRTLVILVVACIVAFAVIPGAKQNASLAGILFSYICFETLMWIYFGELSQQFRLSPVLVFGIGRGCLALASVIGLFFSSYAMQIVETLPYGEGSFVFIMMLAMISAYIMLPSEKDIREIAGLPTCIYDISSDSSTQDYSIEESKELDATLSLEIQQENNELLSNQAENNSQVVNETVADEATQADKKESTAKSSTKKSARKKLDLDTIDKKQKPADQNDIFKLKCAAVSSRYLLSAREQDIVYFLARGFNAAYIQEKLYISEGTAKTHMRHIYRKLDIHNQQALIRLVENTEVDE